MSGIIELDGVVDHQIDGNERLNLAGFFSGLAHGRAQRGEIDDAGHAGEVLQQHAGGHVGKLFLFDGRRPFGQRFHLLGRVGRMTLHAHQRFDQNLDRFRDFRQIAVALFFQRLEAVIAHLPAGGQLQLLLCKIECAHNTIVLLLIGKCREN